jgi:hypothetical protein
MGAMFQVQFQAQKPQKKLNFPRTFSPLLHRPQSRTAIQITSFDWRIQNDRNRIAV